MRRLALAALAAALLLPGRSAAQAVPAPDSGRVRLDTLAVTVLRATQDLERAPLAISVVGRGSIQDGRPTATLDEALAGVPGLVVSNRQNFSLGPRIIMRGMGARAAFGVRGVRVLVDGIPLTMPDGQTNLNNLDLGSAGTIQVLRGPASALHGNAAGGVIAVETESVPDGLATEARLIAGDQGRGSMSRFLKAQGKVAQRVGAVDYLASVARLEVDGYRDHARTRQMLFNGRAGLDLGPATRVSLVVSAMDMPVADNPGALPLEQATADPTAAWPANVATLAGEATRQGQAGLRLRHAGRRGLLDVSAYGIARSLDNALAFGFIQLDRAAGGLRASWEQPWPALPLSPAIVAGVDVEAQRDHRREHANQGGRPVGEARRNQYDRVAAVGPFVQLRGAAGRLGVTAGLRYDAVGFEVEDRRGVEPDRSGARTLDALSSMVGVTYAARPATLFANVATSFQTPTTTELINAPPPPGEPCCPAGFNRDLEPQRARSAEVGARLHWRALLGASITAFRMEVRDALVPFQVPEAEGRDFFRNAARTRHQGVELSAEAALAPTLALSASHTWTDVRFRDAAGGGEPHAGNRVPGIPPRRTVLSLAWSPGPVRLAADFEHTARQYVDDANTAAASAAGRLDLRAETTLRLAGAQLAPFAAVNNLLDERYFGSVSVNATAGRFYEPAPGRTVYIGASVRTGGWRR